MKFNPITISHCVVHASLEVYLSNTLDAAACPDDGLPMDVVARYLHDAGSALNEELRRHSYRKINSSLPWQHWTTVSRSNDDKTRRTMDNEDDYAPPPTHITLTRCLQQLAYWMMYFLQLTEPMELLALLSIILHDVCPPTEVAKGTSGPTKHHAAWCISSNWRSQWNCKPY